jgi:flagellar hook-basal body complex protein FliE
MIPPISPLGTKVLDSFGQGLGNSLGDTVEPASGVGQSFASMLGDAATRVATNLQQAEQLSLEALQGKGDMRAVVDAVMTAEQSLQAALAVRDKIVSAYLEISRMQI